MTTIKQLLDRLAALGHFLPDSERGTIILPPNSTGTEVDTVTLASKDRELIVVAGDGAAAEIAGVTNTQPAHTEYGMVTRPIQRKDGETLTTANLGIDGVFTQTFQDGSQDGIMWVEATARADVASATDGFIIQESDDSADANFTRTVAAASVSANTTTTIIAPIRARYWRVQYTNGGTGQASFRLAATATTLPSAHVLDYDTGTGTQNVPLTGIALPASGGAVAGGTNTNPVQVGDAGGSLTVDGTVSANLNAGTNNIGDVDIASPLGAGTEAAAVRVTVATDSTGVLSVDDNGGSLTVDGTVTANAGTGTFNVQVAAETANKIEVQGDVAHDAAAAGNPVQLGVRANQNEPTAVADADISYVWGDQQGRIVVVQNFPANVAVDSTHGPRVVNITTTGDNAIVAAPGAGQSIYVTNIFLSNDGTSKVTCNVKDGTTTRMTANMAADGGGVNRDFNPPWKLTANTALNAALSATGDVDVNVHYFVAP